MHVHHLHSSAIVCLLAVAGLAGCSDDAPQAAATPGTSAPPAVQEADATPAQPASASLHAAFVSGTGHAATDDRAELVLLAQELRIGDVLERIADISGVPLEVSPDARLGLDRQVTMNFDRVPLRTALELIAQESATRIDAGDDAIRVRPGGTPAG